MPGKKPINRLRSTPIDQYSLAMLKSGITSTINSTMGMLTVPGNHTAALLSFRFARQYVERLNNTEIRGLFNDIVADRYKDKESLETELEKLKRLVGEVQ